MQPGDAGVAVCLTGELRWHALTLATFQQLVLARLRSPHRLYFAGPAGEHHGAALRVLGRLGAQPPDICAYNPEITWAWGPGSMGRPDGPFEMHAATLCTDDRVRPRARRLRFDLRHLPIFRRCLVVNRRSNEGTMPLPSGMDSTAPYNTTRARPCPSAVSLVVQLWQARQSLQLVRSAERRLRIRHGAILRIRPDIFFFRPVELPRPPPGLASWYSMFEESCHVREGVSEAVYGKANLRFLQDFWLYGSRDVMEVALQEPLERLLGFGRDAAAFMACATCHNRPATITPDGRVGEPCCKRKPRSTPKYALHPVPETLNHHYNESRQCLKYTSPYGLLRVNPGEACFVVQARMPKGKGGRLIKAKEWRQVDVASPAVGSRLRGLSPRFLEGVASVYRRCFGLASNLSCPRTVGDRKLFSGAEAPCLRSPTVRCADADGLAAAAGAGRGGFECAGAGLAAVVVGSMHDSRR